MSQVAVSLPTIPSGPVAAGQSASQGYWGQVNGARIISGTLSMPIYGAWVADVLLQTTSPLSGGLTVQIGNLTLVGAVYRQAVFAGRLEARLIAGAGGWGKSVEARGYGQPSGVLRSQVLSDAATEVGEMVALSSDGTVGNNFARMGDSPQMPGKAGRVLRQVAGTQWYVDNAGVTQVKQRPSSVVTSPFTVVSFAGAVGLLEIATEDPASWAPGNTFSSPTVATQTIASVRHEFRPDGVARLRVDVSSGSDDWLDTIRELVRAEVAASLPYAHTYEYTITASTGGTVDALPVDPSSGAPPLTHVTYRGGVPGGTAQLTPGSRVGFSFLDGNPGKPVLAGVYDGTPPLSHLIAVATSLQLGDQSAQPMAHASWLAEVIQALAVLASGLSALTTPPLTPVGSVGDAFTAALSPIQPSITLKVTAT